MKNTMTSILQILKNIVKKVLFPALPKKVLFKLYLFRVNSWCEGKYLKSFKEHVPQDELKASFELTKDEKIQIDNIWHKYVPHRMLYDAWQIEKAMTGKITPKLIPTYIWYGYILKGTCGYMEGRVMSDKGLYGFYFKDILRPHELIRNINGCYYDDCNNLITEQQSIEILLNYHKYLIVKPSICTNGGANVKKIKINNIQDVNNVFSKYQRDFVIQELVEQSKTSAQFNESSLNTFRVVTLLLNGKYTHLFTCIRVGVPGQITDNVSMGGVFVNIDDCGHLSPYGIGFIGNVTTSLPNGTPYKKILIPEVSAINAFAEKLHKQTPTIAVVAWDIALDKNNKPVLIEANMGNSAIFPQFLTNPDLLGDRFDEVMQYAVEHRVRKHVGNDMVMRYDAYCPDFYKE